MTMTRRHALGLGAATLTGIGVGASTGFGAFAQNDTASEGAMQAGTNMMAAPEGDIAIHPVSHASLVLETPAGVIYVDPVGDAAMYEAMPPADLILITHEHGDHYNAETLGALMGENTELVTNPAVFEMLPAELGERASAMANAESTEKLGMPIEAIPAYNTTEDRLQYHPEGRDNGYVLTVAGARIYIAGDTEDIPEMRNLENIDLAFVPMNLPYTMSIEQAAEGVLAFAPSIVYPYHYRGSDVEQFRRMVQSTNSGIEVRLGDWYEDA